MNALIFGAGGQDGFYLTRLLESIGILATAANRVQNRNGGDVGNYLFVESLVKKYRPNYIFHFAANSTTHHDALFDNHNAISTGTINILESVRLHSPKTKVFLSGSALQFKNEGEPINESSPFQANNSYAFSRIQSVYAARYFRKTFGLEIYVGYLFNHDSPLRTERHINQKIVATIKRISTGSNETLEIGNLAVKKEFNFAGDIVEGIWILVNQSEAFEAVIGSGKAHSILDWVTVCCAKYNMNWRDHFIEGESFRPEYKILVSSPKLINSLGWFPKTSFNDLADMMLGEI